MAPVAVSIAHRVQDTIIARITYIHTYIGPYNYRLQSVKERWDRIYLSIYLYLKRQDYGGTHITPRAPNNEQRLREYLAYIRHDTKL